MDVSTGHQSAAALTRCPFSGAEAPDVGNSAEIIYASSGSRCPFSGASVADVPKTATQGKYHDHGNQVTVLLCDCTISDIQHDLTFHRPLPIRLWFSKFRKLISRRTPRSSSSCLSYGLWLCEEKQDSTVGSHMHQVLGCFPALFIIPTSPVGVACT